MALKTLLEKQATAETVKQLENIIEELHARGASDGFVAKLMVQQTDSVKSIADLTACFLALKKDISSLKTSVAVLETTVNLTGQSRDEKIRIGGRLGLIIFIAIVSAVCSFGVALSMWFIKMNTAGAG